MTKQSLFTMFALSLKVCLASPADNVLWPFTITKQNMTKADIKGIQITKQYTHNIQYEKEFNNIGNINTEKKSMFC